MVSLRRRFVTDIPPPIPAAPVRRKAKGFLPPKIVKAVSFFIISFCIVASVVACILAIWKFTQEDTLWRLIASFVVVAGGTALFAVVNGIFGEDSSS